MKKWIAIIATISLISIGFGFYYYQNSKNSNESNYEAERTSTESNTTTNETAQNTNQQNADEEAKKQAEAEQAKKEPTEAEELASFSTKIHTKDSARQNNITITCSTLNNTDIADGQEFSFCNTVGQSSSSRGYKKADIYTNGKKTKGYGGGNCQVSTTLYNAVLEAPGLKVTERHEHSNKVPYIQSGKDAAVAYGSYDFKFINNSGSNIRIKASNTPDAVSIRLVKLA